MQSVKNCFSDSTHQLMQQPEIESGIVRHFDRGVLDLFRGLVPYAYKSDLARYCLLFIYGGWYVDLTLKLLTSVRVADDIDMIVFSDHGCMSMCQPWAIQNGLVYSKPGNPIFLRVIERIANHRSMNIMASLRCALQAQIALGKEVAAEESKINIIKGIFKPLTPAHSFKNLMYVAQSGQLVGNIEHRG